MVEAISILAAMVLGVAYINLVAVALEGSTYPKPLEDDKEQ